MIWHLASERPPLTTKVSELPTGKRLWGSSDSLLLYFWDEDGGREISTGTYFKPEGEPGRFEVKGEVVVPALWSEFEDPEPTCGVCGRPMPSFDPAVLLRLGWMIDGCGRWFCEEEKRDVRDEPTARDDRG